MARKIYFDTETTGFKPGQIAQLSAIIDDDGNISTINYFFEIDYITEGAEKLLNRGVDFYKEASKGVRFKDKADEIYDIFKDATLIAHNLNFDENFLTTEFWRKEIVYRPAGRFDTMEYFKDILQVKNIYNRVKNPSLRDVILGLSINEDKLKNYCARLYNCEDAEYHDSRLDSTAVFVAYQLAREESEKNPDGDWHKAFCNK